MSKWIKCSERMPPILIDVLVTDGVRAEVRYWDGEEWDCWPAPASDVSVEGVSHWMPLPEPPEV